MKLLFLVVTIWAIVNSSLQVSTKVDFDDETVTNSSSSDDDNVEVKHTIVVSTKLKNNRRGLHSSNDEDSSFSSYNTKQANKQDSGEVPIIGGYKAVETTQIKTPDTRRKIQTPSFIINRNIRDDYDFYPNIATNPMQWKPSNHFNNINWWSQEGTESNIIRRIDVPSFQNPGKIHRTITEDSVKEFYCKKCRELSGFKGCPQQRNIWLQTTTPKMKLDGKLAKLN